MRGTHQLEKLAASLISSSLDDLAAGAGRLCVLFNAEYHEFSRLHRRDTDQADQAAIIQVILRHGGGIALHKERLISGGSKQCSALPSCSQEVGDGLGHARPQSLIIRLKH